MAQNFRKGQKWPGNVQEMVKKWPEMAQKWSEKATKPDKKIDSE